MTAAVERHQAAPVPTHLGQGTAIEQSRAVAEVQAAIVVAQQRPRIIANAISEMEQACAQKTLADRSFYRYPRGGQQVTGPSIHLARELARCFGNIQYSVAELRRDLDAGQSEVLAFAWDLQSNTRASAIFIVPHARDVKDKPRQALPELRDIYENNANMGARRVREQIFAVLPVWFRERAIELCAATIAGSTNGVPLPQRIANCIGWYGSVGITVDQLEGKLARKSGAWTEYDLAQLGVIRTALQRGEVTKEEEFPPPQVTADEITHTAPPATDPPEQTPPPEPVAAGKVDPLAPQLRNRILARFKDLGISDRPTRLGISSSIVQRPADRQLKSANELTGDEALKLVETLERALTNPEPVVYLEQLLGLPRGAISGDDGVPGGD
jgi:hypothetical protein